MPKLHLSTYSQAYFTLYFPTKNPHYLQSKKLTIKFAKQETNN